MPNQFNIPEIEPAAVAERRAKGEDILLVDVREAHELNMANLGEGVIHLPLSQIAQQQLDAIPPELSDKDSEIIVVCHHGNRSAQVCAFMRAQGWTNMLNFRGGIHAYALEVDPSIGTY